MPYWITQCYLPPSSGDFLPLPQPKLVLDLSSPGMQGWVDLCGGYISR